MLINLNDFTDKKELRVQMFLAQPNHRIIKPIIDSMEEKYEASLNNLGELTFSIPYRVKDTSLLSLTGQNDGFWKMIDNPDVKLIKEFMAIKLIIGTQEEWFYIKSIQDNIDDSSKMSVVAFSLEGELKRKTLPEVKHTSISVVDYYTEILDQTGWILGDVTTGLEDIYRAFDIGEMDIYALSMTGAETYGLVLKWDTKNRTLNLYEASKLRVFRGLTVREDNFIDTLVRDRETEEVVTRLYVHGDEELSIQHVNPTGQTYIEDFGFFLAPFERDASNNVLQHSAYMSDALAHALLDNKKLQEQYLPEIKNLQGTINKALDDYSLALINQAEISGDLITLYGLLDTAKATDDDPLVAKREVEVAQKEAEKSISDSEVKTLEQLISDTTAEIQRIQALISLTSFTPELLAELQPFIITKDFTDDRYVDEIDLYEAGQKEFEKYSMVQRSFDVSLFSFLEIAEASHMNDNIVLGEEIEIKSKTLDENYRSVIYGVTYELSEGDVRIMVSDNMDDITSLDKLTTLLYNTSSVSNTVNSNKKKWNGIVDVRTAVDQIRDEEIKAVHNKILAGVNESIEISNRGILVTNPDFPNELIIIQSGVIALSQDKGKTWDTSITPRGVIAETLIGKILAGNNLIITNDSGSFTINNDGLTINMDSIFINSGTADKPENIVAKWNDLLIQVGEFADDGLVNEYEKSQLKKNLEQINDVSAQMILVAQDAWDVETPENVYPPEYQIFIDKLKDLNDYLKVTKQTDGYAILDPERMKITSPVDAVTFTKKHTDYEIAKEKFQAVIPLNFTAGQIRITKAEIALEYVANGEVLTQLNLSEEGVKIDGRLLEINSKTEFNADLQMNAGVIKGKDDGIIIDLNEGTITLNKPVTIGSGSNLITKEDLENIDVGIVGFLSNDSAVIPTDASGNNGDYFTATTIMSIFKGTKDDTANWTFTAVPKDGVVGTLSINRYTVTNMTVDTADVIITAKQKDGEKSISKIFSLAKAKAGVGGGNGESATSYWVTSNTNVITKNFVDIYTPEKITITGYAKTGTANPIAYAGRFIIQSTINNLDYVTEYTSASNETSTVFTIPTDKEVKGIKVRFYQSGATTFMLDEQTYPVLSMAEGIAVGDRNIIRNTGNFNKWNIPYNPSGGGVAVTASGDLRIALTTATQTGMGSPITQKLSRTEAYTLTYEARGTGQVQPFIMSTPVNSFIYPRPTASELSPTEFRKFTATFSIPPTLNVDNVTSFSFLTQGTVAGVSHWIEIKKGTVKLVQGNLITNWTKAPEDIEEDIENIDVGVRNLALKSNVPVTSTAYFVKKYDLSENWVVGETYTVQIKGSIATSETNAFGVWRNNGNTALASKMNYDAVKGIYWWTGICPANVTGQPENVISVYNFPSATATSSKIEWIKVEKGNRRTDWLPAPEDPIPNGVNLLKNTKGEWLTETLNNGAYYDIYRDNLNTLFNSLNTEVITISFDAKVSVAGNFRVYGLNGTPMYQIPISLFEGTTAWKRYSMTIQVLKTTATGSSRIEFYGIDNGRKVYIRKLKLERGSLATDWTPNPEDSVGSTQLLNYTEMKRYFGGGLSEWNAGTSATYSGKRITATTDANSLIGFKILVEDSIEFTISGMSSLNPFVYYQLYDEQGGKIGVQNNFLADRDTYGYFNNTFQIANSSTVSYMVVGLGGLNASNWWIEPKLERGGTASDWSRSPQDIINGGSSGENLMRFSSITQISTNNAVTYPITTEIMSEEGTTYPKRTFMRTRRSSPATSPSLMSLFNSIFFTEMKENIRGKKVTISFKARASVPVAFSMFLATFAPAVNLEGALQRIDIETTWKTFSFTVNIPASASEGLRTLPLQSITAIDNSTFYLDTCEWKVEYGDTVTPWLPSVEEGKSYGGENLIKNSELLADGKDWNLVRKIKNNSFKKNYNSAYGEFLSSSTASYFDFFEQLMYSSSLQIENRIEDNTYYTLSFWAKASATSTLRIHMYPLRCDGTYKYYQNGLPIARTASDGSMSVSIGTSWERVVLSFRTSNGIGASVDTRLLWRMMSKGTTMEITQPQLEKGLIASEWKPAPEDGKYLNTDAINTFQYNLVTTNPLLENSFREIRLSAGWGWSQMLVDTVNTNIMLEPSTKYRVRYKYRVDSVTPNTVAFEQSQHGSLFLYSGVSGFTTETAFMISEVDRAKNVAEANAWKVGDVVVREAEFTTPSELKNATANYRILSYTSRRMMASAPATLVGIDAGTFFDIKIEKSDKWTAWSLAPEDVAYLTQLSLDEKANQTDLDATTEIANNANNLAEGAVPQEVYDTWISATYEKQIASINEANTKAEANFALLDERTTLIDNQLGSMTEKWTFIDRSITFGNEGMRISHLNDKMSIVIDSNQITFFDNKTAVAYITSEVLKINKGIFVESATIGNHMIMKYSNSSPVTIVKYVGKL